MNRSQIDINSETLFLKIYIYDEFLNNTFPFERLNEKIMIVKFQNVRNWIVSA